MFKCINYLFVLLSVSISPSFAMDKEFLKSGNITVHLKNEVPGLESDKLPDIIIKQPGTPLPYIVLNPSDSSTYRYITNVNVFLTMLDKQGQITSIRKPLPAEQCVLRCELPFDDRTQLDSISMQIQGYSFKAGVLGQDGKLTFEVDYQYVSWSTWHSLKPKETGWLHGDSLDSLYSYFTWDNALKHNNKDRAYKVVFGNRPWNL